MNFFPEISIIVCTYNHAKWIERCLRSLCHQDGMSSNDYEVILVDDNSSDNTNLIISNYLDVPNLRVIKNTRNLGLPSSINVGIKAARGRYIVRVDSDDYVARTFLSLMRLFLNYNRCYQAVAVDYILVDEFENEIRKVSARDEFIACGIMYRKECIFEIGLYNEDFKMREGHELHNRFINNFKMGYLEFPLYRYRMHSLNRTKNQSSVEHFDQKLKKMI